MRYRRRSAMDRVTCYAPGSTSNVGPGFDCLGIAIAGMGDRVSAARSRAPGVRVLSVSDPRIPCDPARNTAALAAAEVLRQAGSAGVGLELRVEKGLPLSGGLGGSAASAVAGAFAANALLGRPLDAEALLRCALEAEAVVAGPPPRQRRARRSWAAPSSSSASSPCATRGSPSTPRCASCSRPRPTASRPPAPARFSPRASRAPTRWGRPRPWPASSWASSAATGRSCARRWWTAWPSRTASRSTPATPGRARRRSRRAPSAWR